MSITPSGINILSYIIVAKSYLSRHKDQHFFLSPMISHIFINECLSEKNTIEEIQFFRVQPFLIFTTCWVVNDKMPLLRSNVLLVCVALGAGARSHCGGHYTCRIDNNLVDQFSRTETLTECQLHCLAAAECEVYSLDSGLEVCTLFSSCRAPDFSCPHCLTANKYCPGQSPEPTLSS